MLILVNGRREQIKPGTIGAYVRGQNLSSENLVVEHNRHIVRQSEWENIELKPNDSLELLSFVGGG